MTEKDNSCVGSYSVSGYTRGDGISVSSYTRTCGAAHNSSINTTTSTSKHNLTDEKKMQRRADLLYPTMKNKEKNEFNNKPKNIKEYNKEYIDKLKEFSQVESDSNFLNSLDFLIDLEGGYNNIVGDVPTNLGVTQGIYDIYRKEQGLPIQDVKNIKIEEAVPIYYNYFWKPSGAEKLYQPLSFVYFDMYVNSSPKDTKAVLKRSNNDVYKFLENRKKFYYDIVKAKPQKKKFLNGWCNRLEKLKKYVDDYYETKK